MSLLRDNPAIQRVLVFRALQLGDLLCAVPALRALRAALPEAEIVLAGLPWARGFVERFDRYLDGFVAFPGYPGLGERPPDLAALPAFIADLQARRFGFAIQLHGSGTITNPLVATFGAHLNAGFYLPGGYRPDEGGFMAWPESGHEIHRLLELMEFLGAPAHGDALEFPLNEADHAESRALLREADLHTGDYVCVHPGSQLPSRRWPVERFAAVADALAGQGLRIVLTGTAGEAPLTAAVGARMRTPVVDLAGRTSLGGLAALLAGAGLLLSNDTGVSHIAAALRLPSVIVACGSDVPRWAPLDRALHRVLWQPIDCRPCAHVACPLDGHPCAAAVGVEAVTEEAMELLSSGQRSTSTVSTLSPNLSPNPGREELHSMDVRVSRGDRGRSKIVRMPLLQHQLCPSSLLSPRIGRKEGRGG